MQTKLAKITVVSVMKSVFLGGNQILICTFIGRKKSRFKQLKTRLFGKLKKKESEGLMKQSQSASDITAPEGGRESYDSEDECL